MSPYQRDQMPSPGDLAKELANITGLTLGSVNARGQVLRGDGLIPNDGRGKVNASLGIEHTLNWMFAAIAAETNAEAAAVVRRYREAGDGAVRVFNDPGPWVNPEDDQICQSIFFYQRMSPFQALHGLLRGARAGAIGGGSGLNARFEVWPDLRYVSARIWRNADGQHDPHASYSWKGSQDRAYYLERIKRLDTPGLLALAELLPDDEA